MSAAVGTLADFELRAEFATAGDDRRAEIIAEMGARSRLRKSVTGHDRSLCDHPARCVLVGPQRAPKES
jgi:hypothetical protein